MKRSTIGEGWRILRGKRLIINGVKIPQIFYILFKRR